ncbi:MULTISPECIES: ABC transporter permease [Clostridium]|uniref:ABC transporter permease n=1 Tax=Clostridium TaxID=1485 RepID=UPI000CF61DB5|nr:MULTISPECIES: ABC transporter permease [Clostridium]NFT07440.1 ABC transporter permease [Clostridium botulinum]
MKYIKYSYKSIIGKPFLTIIFLIQIIVSSNMIYSVINYNNQIAEKVDASIATFKDKKIYCMTTAGDTGLSIFDNKIDQKNINTAYKMIKQGNYLHFSVYGNNVRIKAFDGVDSFRSTPYEVQINGDKYVGVNEFNIDKNLYEALKFNLFSGSGFKSSDFETLDEIRPCIVGYNYKNFYNVGDVITSFERDTKKTIYFKVVGIMPKSMEVINNLHTKNKLINTDNYIIFPIIDIDKFNNLNLEYNRDFGMSEFYLFNNSYFIFDKSKPDNEIENIFDNINNNLESLGIGKQRVESVDEILQKDMEFLYYNRDSALKTGVIIILFLSLGIITSNIYIINRSKKMYGVYLMSGATIKDIALMSIFKNLIIFILGFLISIGYLKYIYDQFDGINVVTLMETFSILIGLSLVTVIMPTIKILKLKITTLIKED